MNAPCLIALLIALRTVGARAWRWTRPFGAFTGFDARDGACSFSYFNNSDQTFRIGMFGGSTVTAAPSARRAFSDVWFSPAVSRWAGKGASRMGKWVRPNRCEMIARFQACQVRALGRGPRADGTTNASCSMVSLRHYTIQWGMPLTLTCKTPQLKESTRVRLPCLSWGDRGQENVRFLSRMVVVVAMHGI